ncbi:hypothetical protein XIS1_870002 [Xenorhabdus innexi]|uniref:Uncharacterized protein n=1 Tax=Xenorhabdus innexi TaxID=290109 RepID=A0A1N6N181_9GAMM|nr:hypothetical protein XIS1_870002 [Xenorhabdus innexi]
MKIGKWQPMLSLKKSRSPLNHCGQSIVMWESTDAMATVETL